MRRLSTRRLVLWFLVMAAAPGVAAETIAVIGGTVHTLGPQGTIDAGTVLIEDGKVTAVGNDVSIPPGAERIDAAGKVVTPGLFDCYSSLGLVEISLIEQTVDSAYSGPRYGASFDVSTAINPRSTLIPINRIEGVTRALVAPVSAAESSDLIAGLGAVIELGSTSDYLLQRRAAMFATLGEAGARLTGGSRAAAMLKLRESLEDASDYAAHRDAYQEGARREYALSRPDLDALVRLLEGELPLVASVNRASDIEAALDLSRQYDIRLVVLGGAEAWMVAPQLAAAGVPVILDPLRNLPARFETLGATLENAARLHAAGVRIAFSTADGHNPRNLKQAAGNAVAHGLPWEAALRALTVNPARIFGLEDGYGTLEPGVDADLVVWSGDPLEVTSFADAVLIRGRRIPMVSRQTLLRDRYLDLDRELPPAYHIP